VQAAETVHKNLVALVIAVTHQAMLMPLFIWKGSLKQASFSITMLLRMLSCWLHLTAELEAGQLCNGLVSLFFAMMCISFCAASGTQPLLGA
jgi:hypothetical protein